MNRTWTCALLLLAASFGLAAQDTPLGDVARQSRQQKKSPTRVLTNEDVAIAPAESTSSAQKPKATEAAAPSAKAKPAASTDYAAHFEQQTREYREKIRQQKADVEKLKKEIAALEHEVQVQSTNYYYDAGARLRSPEVWVQQRQKMDAEIAKRKDKLASAQEKLDATRDEARRMGLGGSVLEP